VAFEEKPRRSEKVRLSSLEISKAKALGWESVWHILGAARNPILLEHREQGAEW
jgi:hypothetical protein